MLQTRTPPNDACARACGEMNKIGFVEIYLVIGLRYKPIDNASNMMCHEIKWSRDIHAKPRDYVATLIAKDRQSSFMHRLYTTPMTPADFILGYTLPVIPVAVAQGIICYVVAIILGLDFSVNILYIN